MTTNTSLYAPNPMAVQSARFQASSAGWNNEAILALVAVLMMLLIPLGGWVLKHWTYVGRGTNT